MPSSSSSSFAIPEISTSISATTHTTVHVYAVGYVHLAKCWMSSQQTPMPVMNERQSQTCGRPCSHFDIHTRSALTAANPDPCTTRTPISICIYNVDHYARLASWTFPSPAPLYLRRRGASSNTAASSYMSTPLRATHSRTLGIPRVYRGMLVRLAYICASI